MKPALIIGAAECVKRDLKRLKDMVGAPLDEVFTIFAVNDGGVVWGGRVDHWVTLHPDELPEREKRRHERGGPDGYVTWGNEGDVDKVVHPDYRIDGMTGAGLAIGVARSQGHGPKVLAGCPLEEMGYAVDHRNHGDGSWPYWRTYQEALPSLMKQHPWIAETVRSMSGFTKRELGEPTVEWLGAA